jgi:metal-responsive CopG/Arc/MetJ family transcriptional regulator
MYCNNTFLHLEVKELADTQLYNMKYPIRLLKRIDKFKKEKGFTTRSQAIIFLLQNSLDSMGIEVDRKEKED